MVDPPPGACSPPSAAPVAPPGTCWLPGRTSNSHMHTPGCPQRKTICARLVIGSRGGPSWDHSQRSSSAWRCAASAAAVPAAFVSVGCWLASAYGGSGLSSWSLLLQCVSELSLSSPSAPAPPDSDCGCGGCGGGCSPPPLGCLWRFSSSAQSVGCPSLSVPPAAPPCCACGLGWFCWACFRSHARSAFCSLLRVLCSPLPSCLFLALLAMASSNVSPSRMYQCAGPSCFFPPAPSACPVCGGCWSWQCSSASWSSSSSVGGCGGGGLGCALAAGRSPSAVTPPFAVGSVCAFALGGHGGGCLTGGPGLALVGGIGCWCCCPPCPGSMRWWSAGCWAPWAPPLLAGWLPGCVCDVWLVPPAGGLGPCHGCWGGVLGPTVPMSGELDGCWGGWVARPGWCPAACCCAWSASRAFRLCCRSSCSTTASHGALAGTMGIVTVRCSSCSPMVGTWVEGRKGGRWVW